MAISAVGHNVSFRQKYKNEESVVGKIKEKYKETEVGANEAIAATLGTGTAVTVGNITKSGKVLTLAQKVLPSNGKSLFNVFNNTKASFLGKVGEVGMLAKFIKWGPVQGIVGLFGTVFGIAAFVTNGVNIVGTTAKVAESEGLFA